MLKELESHQLSWFVKAGPTSDSTVTQRRVHEGDQRRKAPETNFKKQRKISEYIIISLQNKTCQRLEAISRIFHSYPRVSKLTQMWKIHPYTINDPQIVAFSHLCQFTEGQIAKHKLQCGALWAPQLLGGFRNPINYNCDYRTPQ